MTCQAVAQKLIQILKNQRVMKKASVVQHIIPSWFGNVDYADLKLTYNEVYLQIVFLQSLS